MRHAAHDYCQCLPLFSSTAVYGVFFFIGTFALGVLRAFIPKLALLSIFGSIVLDIVSIIRC